MHTVGLALAIALLGCVAFLFCKGMDKVLELIDDT
jgi:hypothetical protein